MPSSTSTAEEVPRVAGAGQPSMPKLSASNLAARCAWDSPGSSGGAVDGSSEPGKQSIPEGSGSGAQPPQSLGPGGLAPWDRPSPVGRGASQSSSSKTQPSGRGPPQRLHPGRPGRPGHRSVESTSKSPSWRSPALGKGLLRLGPGRPGLLHCPWSARSASRMGSVSQSSSSMSSPKPWRQPLSASGLESPAQSSRMESVSQLPSSMARPNPRGPPLVSGLESLAWL
mmetsp:Transcript_107343/g.341967  ORF Transcript_107343/g.341967 Transcript_107343/m.341967 type:complete len:227 (+) Transcript_107343:1493-2173(+)